MISRFLSAAEKEFADAGIFYETERAGLGDEFFKTIQAAIHRLEETPKLDARSIPITDQFWFYVFPAVLFTEFWTARTSSLQSRIKDAARIIGVSGCNWVERLPQEKCDNATF